jgi:hypothetical protein
MEHMEGDYVAIPELDRYDHGVLDGDSYDNIDPRARRAAEVTDYHIFCFSSLADGN